MPSATVTATATAACASVAQSEKRLVAVGQLQQREADWVLLLTATDSCRDCCCNYSNQKLVLMLTGSRYLLSDCATAAEAAVHDAKLPLTRAFLAIDADQ